MPTTDPYFEAGDTIKMGKSASIPEATVRKLLVTEDGTLSYRLSWSNGTENVQPVEQIDREAINTPRRR